MLLLLIAVGEGVHVGVVEQGVVAVPPRELLENRKILETILGIAFECQSWWEGPLSEAMCIKCKVREGATNTLVLLIAIRESVDMAVVEKGVVSISPGELLHKGKASNKQ